MAPSPFPTWVSENDIFHTSDLFAFYSILLHYTDWIDCSHTHMCVAGMFGISQFSAVINPPQAAILAVGSGLPQCVKGEKGGLETATVMNVRLSTDRRVADEAASSQFLQSFRTYIESPMLMATV